MPAGETRSPGACRAKPRPHRAWASGVLGLIDSITESGLGGRLSRPYPDVTAPRLRGAQLGPGTLRTPVVDWRPVRSAARASRRLWASRGRAGASSGHSPCALSGRAQVGRDTLIARDARLRAKRRRANPPSDTSPWRSSQNPEVVTHFDRPAYHSSSSRRPWLHSLRMPSNRLRDAPGGCQDCAICRARRPIAASAGGHGLGGPCCARWLGRVGTG